MFCTYVCTCNSCPTAVPIKPFSFVFFSVHHVAAVGGAAFVSPGSAKMPRKRFGQQSNIGPRWCALPFRLAANLQLAWIKSGQTNFLQRDAI